LAYLAVSCTVAFALFGVIFRSLPDTPQTWNNISHGALIASILFSAAGFGLAIYFKYSRINNVYGAAGSLVAGLTWIYYSTFSRYFGAEFTKVCVRR
jgi:membrane protein